jgi:hypothetical protein
MVLRPEAELPEPMPPVREDDSPGAVCYRVTPEIYLGHQRGQIGNPSGATPAVRAPSTQTPACTRRGSSISRANGQPTRSM